ncbi:MAG TPA: hypothetical protein VF487_19280, partial [Chitinophagaceae bacterium]
NRLLNLLICYMKKITSSSPLFTTYPLWLVLPDFSSENSIVTAYGAGIYLLSDRKGFHELFNGEFFSNALN